MKKINITSVITAIIVSLVMIGFVSPAVVFAVSSATVNLGTAGNFVILAKTGISTTGSTSIVGDLGLSPAAATYITGFGLILPLASTFSTSSLVTGKVYASDYIDPTPANLTTAVLDMQTAYTDAAGRAPSVTELGAGNIGGLTLAPGVYKWGTGVIIPANVTLSGGANDIWIFQIAQNLEVSSSVKVVLAGGAQAGNIFWQVAGQTTIGTGATFNGNILDQTAIVLNTGAQLNGRALAQTAVTLDANTVLVLGTMVEPVESVEQVIPILITPEASITPITSTAPTSVAPTPTVPVVSVTQATPTPTPTPTPISELTPAPTFMPTPGIGTSSASNREALIAKIREQINALQEQMKTQGMATPNANAIVNANANASFKRNLMAGSTGGDVKALQVWLNTHGHAVASNGPGSLGNETITFGTLTRTALANFQAQRGIKPSLGNFGVITRAYIEANK